MIIHYTPCESSYPAIWSQPHPDAIRCEWRGKVYECDFSDAGVEYDIPAEVAEVVHRAWRESDAGPLHLQVPSLGALSEPVTIDHGDAKELGYAQG